MARRYDPSGNFVGSETQLNVYTDVSNPCVDVGPNHFVAGWKRMEMGVTEVVTGQLYDIDGTPIGGQFSQPGRNPKVAIHASGSFVLIWERVDTLDINVYGQRFDASSNPVGTDFRVNTYTSNSQESPAVTMDENGGFVVVWQSYGQDGDGQGIYAQLYTSAGVPRGESSA
jgi:hypothetical protein